jgi:hypothetical protein
MSPASPAYLEIIDFIAAGTTPEAVARFRLRHRSEGGPNGSAFRSA